MGSILLLLLACSSGAKPDPDSAAQTTTTFHSADDTATTPTETATTESTPTDSTAGPDTVDDDGDGYSEAEGDCDDESASTHPGAYEEHCGQRDANCDGLTNQYCVKVNEHRYSVWSFDSTGLVRHDVGARWRTDDGDLACTTVGEQLVGESEAICPDCQYTWGEASHRWYAYGVGCWDLVWESFGSDMLYVSESLVWRSWGYVQDWSGPSRYSADPVTNFTGWVEYDARYSSAWEAGTYVGHWEPAWWYQYYIGTQRWVGYESSYWSDYAYTYVGPGFPIP